MAETRSSQAGGRPAGRSLLLLLGGALVLLLAGAAWWFLGRPAGPGPEQASRTAAPARMLPGKAGPGQVAGIVLAEDGKPVAEALVSLIADLEGATTPVLTSSDAGGRFRFDQVAPGRLQITATSADSGSGASAPFTLAEGQELNDVQVTLHAGSARLTGKVADSGGGPIPGALVLLRALDDRGDPAPLAVRADGEGQFVVRLAEGVYRLVVSASGYASLFTSIRLTGQQQETFRLSPASSISGRVVERGAGVAGAEVFATSEGRPTLEATSAEDGRFSFPNLPAGTYALSARRGALRGRAAALVRVSPGDSHDGSTIELEQGLRITGQVEGAGGASATPGQGTPQAPASIQVQALKLAAGEWISYPGRVEDGGRFEIAGLEAGDYRVQATAPGLPPASVGVRLFKDVSGLILRFAKGASVQGRVLDAGGQPASARILARTCPDRVAIRCGTPVRAVAGDDGQFALAAIEPGFLWVIADGKQGAAETGPLALGPDQQLKLELRLAAGAHVSGTVRSPDGAPVSGAVVRAGRHQSVSGADGRYRLGPLPAGAHTVEALAHTQQQHVPPASARQVTLAAGETKEGVDLRLEERKARIVGTVTSAKGEPLAGALVTVDRVVGGVVLPGQTEGTATTGGDGAFELGGLPAGPVQVSATLPGYGAETVRASAGGAPVLLRLSSGGTLSGHVQDEAGARVTSYTAVLYGSNADDPYAAAVQRRTHQPIARLRVTDPEGAFKFDDLPPGSYEVLVTTYQRSGGQASDIRLGRGAPARVVVVTRPNLALRGKVVDGKTRSPLPGVRVRATFPTLDLATATDASGEFVFADAVVGQRVDLRLDTQGGEYVTETFTVTVASGKGAGHHVGELPMLKADLGERARVGMFGWTLEAQPATGTLVLAVQPGGLASQHEVKPGFAFQVVDGVPVNGMGVGAVNYLLRGRPDTEAEVVLARADGARHRFRFRRSPMQ